MYAYRVNKVEIGKRLRKHRENRPKITLQRLSKETRALSVSRISNYEQGTRLLKAKEAKLLADAFVKLEKPVTAAYLLCLEDAAATASVEETDTPLKDHDGAYERLCKIVVSWPLLTKDEQQSAVDHVSRLAHKKRSNVVKMPSGRKA